MATHQTSTTTPFGQWLSQQRQARDLTQEELAERIGCSDSSIQKIEVGDRRPSKQVAELPSSDLASRQVLVENLAMRKELGDKGEVAWCLPRTKLPICAPGGIQTPDPLIGAHALAKIFFARFDFRSFQD
jgi:Helix-turn-helix